jgi:flavin reductase (DIM6/NTAB) family NADH-FMN oxidoreductase RutF
MSTSDFDPVLGRVPSGVFILTVGSGDRATGMLASWVMQAGFDPPMVSVAVRKGRYVEEWMTGGAPFNLNLVAEKQFSILKHFAKGFEPDAPAFEGINVRHCARAVPILTDCLGHMECEPVTHCDSGDHRVFVAKVVRGSLQHETPPMVHIRRSGKNY